MWILGVGLALLVFAVALVAAAAWPAREGGVRVLRHGGKTHLDTGGLPPIPEALLRAEERGY